MNELGIICDIKDNKAKVAIGDMVTDFLSVFQSLANSYAVSFSPLRIGEQVLVIPVRGDLNSGVILRGLYQEKHRAKNTDENTFNIDFEDGTHLEYNSKSSTLKLDVVKEYLSADERRPLTDEVNVELAKKREFIVDAKLLLLELSRANEISQKINALQKDFDLSVDLALGFIYKCLHQDGVYKSEILSIKEKIINEEEQELKDLPLENIIIADDEFATLSFSLSYEKAVL